MLSWIRAVKSPAELNYIREAAKIADATVTAAAEMIRPGVRQCDVAAEVMKIQAREGVLTAIPPMIMVDDKAVSRGHSRYLTSKRAGLPYSSCRVHHIHVNSSFLRFPPTRAT